MRLIIDAYSVPGRIVELCEQAGESLQIESLILRERENDLYKLASEDFDTELERNRDLTALTEELWPQDILITQDLDLALLALPLTTAVLDASGKVYTEKALNLEKIDDELARLQGVYSERVRKIAKRDEAEDDAFVTTLITFLENIE